MKKTHIALLAIPLSLALAACAKPAGDGAANEAANTAGDNLADLDAAGNGAAVDAGNAAANTL